MADEPPEVYSYEDEIKRWKNEYLEIKKLMPVEMGTPGDADTSKTRAEHPVGKERRMEPRYEFKEGSKIYAHLGPKAFPILNISIGGLAFHSELYFEPGTKVLMSALGMIALDVEVLNCIMEETDSDLMEFKYLVRAKFGPRVNGYQVYVLAREMYLQETDDTEFLFPEQKPE